MNKQRLTKRVLQALSIDWKATGAFLKLFHKTVQQNRQTVHLTLAFHLVLCNLRSRNNFVHIPRFHRYVYSKTCLKRTPYIPGTWTNGK